MNKGSKAGPLVGTVALLLLLALGFLSLKLAPAKWENLVLVTPKTFSSAGLNPDKIEDFCEDHFLVTYEIVRSGRLNNGQSDYSVTLIATNNCYPFLLHYPMLAGGFWSKSAYKGKERQLALNEKAASQIFGGNDIIGLTLEMDQESWLVTGVIQDGYEDEARAYLPSSRLGGNPKSLLALNNSTLASAISALKDLGVQETNYNIVDLKAAARQYREWCYLACFLIFCLVFAFGTRQGIGWLKAQLGLAREELHRLYPGEFFRFHRLLVLKSSAWLIALLAGAILVLVFLIRMLAIILRWRDLPLLKNMLTEGAWLNKIAPLVDYRLLGLGLFWGFIAALLVFAIVTWRRKAIRNSQFVIRKT